MSIKLLSAAWDLQIGSTEKMVLMCLCDFANENGTCWPSIATLCRKTSKSERTVQSALKWLRENDFYQTDGYHKQTPLYVLNTRNICTPAEFAPPQNLHVTPAKNVKYPRKSRTQTLREPLESPIVCETDVSLKPEHIVEKWNKTAAALAKPQVKNLTPERRQNLKARISQYGIDDFIEVFDKIEASAFLRGDTGWRGCGFDWTMKKCNFQKILEGNYDK